MWFLVMIDERESFTFTNGGHVELLIKYLRELGYKPTKAQLLRYDWEDNELFIEISLSKESEKK